MTVEKLDQSEFKYNDDKWVSQKDLKILSLELKIEFERKLLELKMELEQKINSVVYKLGGIVIATSGILFAALSYFHK